ncbi:hypothetical protein BDD43_3543 [Mucilaginibacter gracilis]|uniref:Uncharacterized protein n=2 Tax=Mucilaginibacter gracilis TaxID=423350 RepID=A0A495J4M6_9SPHI|nr:hypothetical protein BDD43_3543 [Mucilaginibacter gracilis]
MLHAISWPQFLVAAGVFGGLWCLAIAALYYREEFQGLFKGRGKSEEDAWREELEEEQDGGLMGKGLEPEGMETVSMQDLHFASQPGSEELGLVPDVLEELKYIFYQLEQTDGTKADFLELFGEVTEKYPELKDSAKLPAIHAHIRENVSFEITNEELEGLWNA